MKVPNAERAVIEEEKLCDYLLNVAHRRGGSKAKMLVRMGYSPEHSIWQTDLGTDYPRLITMYPE